MDRKLLDYLPDALRPYRELRAIAAGQQALFEALWQSLDRTLDELNDAFGFGVTIVLAMCCIAASYALAWVVYPADAKFEKARGK